MLSPLGAAALLSKAGSLDGLAVLLDAAGLAHHAVPLDPRSSAELGVTERAHLAAGTGAIRVLVLEATPAHPLRDQVRRLATRLSARAPHVLWLLGVWHSASATAVLAAWSGGARPRISSFTWEPENVMPSDADTLRTLAAARADQDVLLHTRWLETLGRDALTRRFYRVLEAEVSAMAQSLPGAAAADARTLALLYTSRLLFLGFLEAKGWMDGDRQFLSSRFDDCIQDGARGGFHRRVLLPLFFGTLNTPFSRRAPAARAFGRVPFLNGGLFTRSAVERRLSRSRFSDERFGALIANVFQAFRFVAREDSADWSDASVDPEMLGRAFECLMAPAERRHSGTFYTPHALVARVAEGAIDALPRAQREDLGALRRIRVLDPACGSGAFLVDMLERLGSLRRALGDRMPVAEIRRDVLTRSLFGVDRDPVAVWLCELRLWLAVVVESEETDALAVPPLPNLDRNIRVGDALAGPAFATASALPVPARLATLRERYVRSTGAAKDSLARQLDREERRRALLDADRRVASTHAARREFLTAQRARDLFGERATRGAEARRESRRLREALRAARLERRRVADGGALPFSFPVAFAEAHQAGGFDVVVGNPPWVRLHRIPGRMRETLKRDFAVFRTAPWRDGAAGAKAGTGFASQVDLAALFTERSVTVLRPGGVVSLLLPAKLWRSLSAGGLRHLLRADSLERLEDLSESRHAFDAAVYPSLLVVRRGAPRPLGQFAIHDREGARTWAASVATLPFDATPGAPWLLLPPKARAEFDLLRAHGVPLSATPYGAPRLGVKSGCNTAFLVRVRDHDRDVACVENADGETGRVELSLLRPVLRGDAVRAWARTPCDEWIIWTHDVAGPLPRLPERARLWLRRHYDTLTNRSDARRARRWWSLFRVEAASSDRPRVVWADIGKRCRALVLEPGDPVVPMNTCYVVRCEDSTRAWALAALLNSDVATAWLNALAEPARGSYRRYLGWTLGLLPIPRDWDAHCPRLAAVGRAVADGAATGALETAVLDAFGIDATDVSELLQCR